MIFGPISPEEVSGRLVRGSPWTEIISLGATDSTNSLAMELASSGAKHATVVIADEQTFGRGRGGRRWVSPPGRNIYVSLILRPKCPHAKAQGLSLAAGAALADVAECAGDDVFLKWPNDLYLGNRKAAGILVETAYEGDALKYAVVGVGVNVNLTEEEISQELRGKATSFAIHAGRIFSREEILAGFLNVFDCRYEEFIAGGFPAIRPAWSRRDMLLDRRVLIRRGDEETWGVARGVDDDGVLLFRPDGASRDETVQSGEIACFL